MRHRSTPAVHAACALAAFALAAVPGCRPDTPPIPEMPVETAPAVVADTLRFDPYSSRVLWSRGGAREARFRAFEGGVAMLADSVMGMRLVLDATSAVQTGVERTRNVTGLDALNAARYPEVVFESTRLRRDAGSSVTLVEGLLTYHGVARPITFPASLRVTRGSVGFSASFEFEPARWDSLLPDGGGAVRVRANLIARDAGTPAPGASMRAMERYQDSLAASEAARLPGQRPSPR